MHFSVVPNDTMVSFLLRNLMLPLQTEYRYSELLRKKHGGGCEFKVSVLLDTFYFMIMVTCDG